MERLARVHFDKCDPDRDGLIDRDEYPLLQTLLLDELRDVGLRLAAPRAKRR